MKKRRATFRPTILDVLEDRAVPSTGGTTSHASSAGSGVQARLTPVVARVEAAYSAFATSVRQSELTLLPAGGATVPTGNTSSVSVQVAQEVAALESAITSAVQGVASGNAVRLLQQQLTGTSPGSLSAGLAEVLNAASAGSANGSVAPATLPLLFTAVNEAIASSYNATAIEVSIDVTVHASTGSSFNLARYKSQINAGYANFATTVRQAETTLVSPGGPSAAVNLAIVIGQQIQTLEGTVASVVPASDQAVIQGQFAGASPGALDFELASLIAASAVGSPDGSVPQSSLPLLFAAVDAAISASYNAAAVEGNLLSYVPPPSVAELNGKGADTTIFSSYGVFFAF